MCGSCFFEKSDQTLKLHSIGICTPTIRGQQHGQQFRQCSQPYFRQPAYASRQQDFSKRRHKLQRRSSGSASNQLPHLSHQLWANRLFDLFQGQYSCHQQSSSHIPQSHSYTACEAITTDRRVLTTVLEHTIQFQASSLPCPFSGTHLLSCCYFKTFRLRASAAIERVAVQHWGKGLYSHYFLIPNSKGGLRLILYHQSLKKYIRYIRSHMVNQATILHLLNHDWFAALNLQDACFHIAALSNHRKYLRFIEWVSIINTQYSSILSVFIKCRTIMAAFLG